MLEGLKQVVSEYGQPYGFYRKTLFSKSEQYIPNLVSIVIPCYNYEKYIADAIESALNQTYRAIEVVVVDDGSTDGSLQIIQSYGDRVVCHAKENGGGGAARNDGLELAQGEFIQFLDADDLLLPTAVEDRLMVMEEGVDAVFGDMEYMDEDGQKINGRDVCHGQLGWPPDDLLYYILFVNIHTPLPLHRRQWVYKVGGFDEKLPRGQETDFHFRLSLCGYRFKHVPKVVASARDHASPERIGTQAKKWFKSDPDRYIRWVYNLLGVALEKSPEKVDQLFIDKIARYLLNYGRQALDNNEVTLYGRYLLEARKINPGYRHPGKLGLVERCFGYRLAACIYLAVNSARRTSCAG